MIAVIEFAARPVDGGVYLWQGSVRDFMVFFRVGVIGPTTWMYVADIMRISSAVLFFVLGRARVAGGQTSRLRWLLRWRCSVCAVILNVVGLAWAMDQHLGGIGSFAAAFLLMVLDPSVWLRFGRPFIADFRIPAKSAFVLIRLPLFVFTGWLELASIMGDEIENPRKTCREAVAGGGLLSDCYIFGAT